MSNSNINIPVPTTGTAVMAQGAYGSAFQVANTGSNEIFIGSDSSVSVTSGLPLQPGGSTSWNGDTPLWVVAVAGAPSQVTMQFGSSGSYSPGQAVVSIAGTVPVSGAVSVPGGVGVNGSVLNNPANNLQLLDSQTVNFAAGVNGGQLYNANVPADVSQFSCLIIRVRVTSSATPNATNYIDLQANQAPANANTSQGKSYHAQWLNCSNEAAPFGGLYELKVPIETSPDATHKNFFILSSFLDGTPTGVTKAFRIDIYGSHEQINETLYTNGNPLFAQGAPSGLVALLDNATIAGTVTAFLESINGDTDVNFFKGGTTATASRFAVNMLNNGVAVVVCRGRIETGAGLGSNVAANIKAPMRPLTVTIVNETAALTQDFTATISQ